MELTMGNDVIVNNIKELKAAYQTAVENPTFDGMKWIDIDTGHAYAATKAVVKGSWGVPENFISIHVKKDRIKQVQTFHADGNIYEVNRENSLYTGRRDKDDCFIGVYDIAASKIWGNPIYICIARYNAEDGHKTGMGLWSTIPDILNMRNLVRLGFIDG